MRLVYSEERRKLKKFYLNIFQHCMLHNEIDRAQNHLQYPDFSHLFRNDAITILGKNRIRNFGSLACSLCMHGQKPMFSGKSHT